MSQTIKFAPKSQEVRRRGETVTIALDSEWTNEEIASAERFARERIPSLGCGRADDDWGTAFVSTGILPGVQIIANTRKASKCAGSIVKSKDLFGFHLVIAQRE